MANTIFGTFLAQEKVQFSQKRDMIEQFNLRIPFQRQKL